MDGLSSLTPLTSDPAYFGKLVAMAAKICGTPVALTNYFSRGWQHTVASVGLCLQPMRLEDSVCNYTVRHGDLFVVPDMSADERFRTRSYVTGPPHIRFYAGVPVFESAAGACGALCVLDYVPREISSSQAANLRQLARLLSASLQRNVA